MATQANLESEVRRRVDFNRGRAPYWPIFTRIKGQWVECGNDIEASSTVREGLAMLVAYQRTDLETAAECHIMLSRYEETNIARTELIVAMYQRLVQVAVANDRQDAAQKFRAILQRVKPSTSTISTPRVTPQSGGEPLAKKLKKAVHNDSDERAPTPGISATGRSLLNRIMSHPELMLAFVSNLTPTSLVNLYAVSKPFHYLFNKHYTTFLLANVRTYCGLETETIFPYYAYRRLCKLDPMRRDVNASVTLGQAGSSDGSSMVSLARARQGSHVSSNTTIEAQARQSTAEPPSPKLRQIPGIKWLKMVTHRLFVIRQIIASISIAGHLLPYRATSIALQKLWFLMDLQTNGLRIGCIHNRECWTNTDLKVAYYFFTRLDMRFTDAIKGNGSLSLRKLLLRQRGLTPIMETLQRGKYVSQVELVKSVVHLYRGVSQARIGHAVLGLPPQLVGRGEREAHGRSANRLLRPDQLVLMEMLRRKIDPGKLILPFLLAGRSQMRALRRMPPIKCAIRRR